MGTRRTLGRLAAVLILAALASATILLIGFWRSIRSGALLEAEALAGPDTLLLVGFTLTREDPGVVEALARIDELDRRRRRSRLPAWAKWLLSGSTGDAPSVQAAAVLPVRVLAFMDRRADGEISGAVVVSLSRYTDRIAPLLGVDASRRHDGIAFAVPERPGDPYTALVGNNIVLGAREEDLFEAIDRLNRGGPGPGALLRRAARAAPRRGDGIAVLLNPGDALERSVHGALARRGIEVGEEGGAARIVPAGLLGSGVSLDLVSAEDARVEGTLFFLDPGSAEEAVPWVRRRLPVAFALLGLESEFRVEARGDELRVTGTLRGLDVLWDRIVAGRLTPRLPTPDDGTTGP